MIGLIEGGLRQKNMIFAFDLNSILLYYILDDVLNCYYNEVHPSIRTISYSFLKAYIKSIFLIYKTSVFSFLYNLVAYFVWTASCKTLILNSILNLIINILRKFFFAFYSRPILFKIVIFQTANKDKDKSNNRK